MTDSSNCEVDTKLYSYNDKEGIRIFPIKIISIPNYFAINVNGFSKYFQYIEMDNKSKGVQSEKFNS